MAVNTPLVNLVLYHIKNEDPNQVPKREERDRRRKKKKTGGKERRKRKERKEMKEERNKELGSKTLTPPLIFGRLQP